MSKALRILLVEDEVAVANTLATILRQRSHEVTIACTGEEALRCGEFDVVIADVGLDGISGLDVLEELLLRGESPRALVVSGDRSVDNCRRALRLGAVDYLTKPFDVNEFVRLVEEEAEQEAAPSVTTYERSYRASRESCDQGPRDLAAFALRCGIGPAARARIASATAEALENVWRHAYPQEVGMVRVEARVSPRQMIVTVRDEGQGMDTILVGCTPLEGAATHGFARMCSLAEDVLVRSELDAGTSVQMEFATYSARFDESARTDLSELDWLSPQMARTVLSVLDEPGIERAFQFSPALAVSIGRLLSGPNPLRESSTTLHP